MYSIGMFLNEIADDWLESARWFQAIVDGTTNFKQREAYEKRHQYAIKHYREFDNLRMDLANEENQ